MVGLFELQVRRKGFHFGGGGWEESKNARKKRFDFGCE